MTPLQRLLVFVVTLGQACAVVAIGVYFSIAVMVGVVVAWAILALLATLEATPDPADAIERARDLNERERDGLRQVPRRETERRAREARGE